MSVKYSSMKGKVTKDWAGFLPSFEVWKPKHLVRLHGPLVMGICLDAVRSPDAYQPYFHFHALTTPEQSINLSLAGPLLSRGCAYEVTLRRHDSELNEIVQKLTQQYPLIATKKLTYRDYVQTVANVRSGKHGATRGGSLPLIYRDIVLLAYLCGEVEHAQSEFQAFIEDLAVRPDCNAPYIGGLEKWRAGVESMLDPVKLAGVVSDEKKKHKFEGFPDHGIEFDTPVKLFDLWEPTDSG
jgi:hypothetical protein